MKPSSQWPAIFFKKEVPGLLGFQTAELRMWGPFHFCCIQTPWRKDVLEKCKSTERVWNGIQKLLLALFSLYFSLQVDPRANFPSGLFRTRPRLGFPCPETEAEPGDLFWSLPALWSFYQVEGATSRIVTWTAAVWPESVFFHKYSCCSLPSHVVPDPPGFETGSAVFWASSQDSQTSLTKLGFLGQASQERPGLQNCLMVGTVKGRGELKPQLWSLQQSVGFPGGYCRNT